MYPCRFQQSTIPSRFKNPKQKQIKSKPIQQENSIKSNISYPNLKKFTGVDGPQVFLSMFLWFRSSHSASFGSPLSFSASFPVSSLPLSLSFIASLFLFPCFFYLILASEHALTRVLRGSSIFWVRVNLEHLLYLGLLHFSITKKT